MVTGMGMVKDITSKNKQETVLSIFNKRKEKKSVRPLMVDVHSHLIPGNDDGSSSMEESLELIQTMSDLGYQKNNNHPSCDE